MYKSSAYLPMVLSSLRAQTYTDWKLFLCENSGDAQEREKAEAMLRESGLPYEYSQSTENLGFADGHNHLMQMHQAEYILLLNEDAYLAPDYLEKTIHAFDADTSRAAVCGPVYRWTTPVDEQQPLNDETLIDTLRLRYTCLAQVTDEGAGEKRGTRLQELRSAYAIWGASGAVVTYRRSAIERISPEGLLFVPGFFMYKEDVDLVIRLQRARLVTWFDPAIVSFHRRSVEGIATVREGLRLRGVRIFWERVQQERKRSPHIRVPMYRNTWLVLVYHLSFALGMKDIVQTLARSVLYLAFIFIASPALTVKAIGQFFARLPKALERRSALYRLGLPSTRLAK